VNQAPAWLAATLGNEATLYGLVALLLIAEASFPLRDNVGDSVRRWTLHGGLLLLSRGVGWVIAGGISWAFAYWSIRPGDAWAGWLHLLLMLLVLDLLIYGIHRASHAVPLLWRFHSMHHSDKILDAGTSWRHHPGEMIITGVVAGAVAGILGIRPFELAIYAVLAESVQVIAHANIAIPRRLAGWASMVLVTPALHHAHHSPDVDYTDSNYGEVLIIWDRLFGTLNAAPYPALFGLGPATGSQR
jgi:sterol desaturase/sphingolipid hydroxylase (fatty acid hydroxylase superfamily)